MVVIKKLGAGVRGIPGVLSPNRFLDMGISLGLHVQQCGDSRGFILGHLNGFNFTSIKMGVLTYLNDGNAVNQNK